MNVLATAHCSQSVTSGWNWLVVSAVITHPPLHLQPMLPTATGC